MGKWRCCRNAGLLDQAIFPRPFRTSINQGEIPKDWSSVAVVHRRRWSEICQTGQPRQRSMQGDGEDNPGLKIRISSRTLNAPPSLMNNRSCLINLLCFLNEVTLRVNEDKQVEICCLDFSEVFDSVNHRLSLIGLESFDIRGQAYQ